MNDPFKTFGPPELGTWRYAPGICRFQTTSPRFARKLSQRSRARLVAWSVSKGYLRIFEEPMQPWRAQRLVTRCLTAANEAFSQSVGQPHPSRTATKVAGRIFRKKNGTITILAFDETAPSDDGVSYDEWEAVRIVKCVAALKLMRRCPPLFVPVALAAWSLT